MNVYDETVRMTKLIFNEIYAKKFVDRKELDSFIVDFIRKHKVDETEYSYISLYLSDFFSFHIKIINDGQYSVTTFSFYMIWDDRKFDKYDTDNINIYIGTPFYWFGRNEQSDIIKIKDEIEITI